MMSLDELKARYDEAAERIARAVTLRDRRRIAPFATRATGNGSAHVEVSGSTFFYVVTERGEELERRGTADADELLYWLVSDVAFSAACEWEGRHRSWLEDFRRRLFRKEAELMGMISAAWGQRKEQEHARVLENNPFVDRAPWRRWLS